MNNYVIPKIILAVYPYKIIFIAQDNSIKYFDLNKIFKLTNQTLTNTIKTKLNQVKIEGSGFIWETGDIFTEAFIPPETITKLAEDITETELIELIKLLVKRNIIPRQKLEDLVKSEILKTAHNI